jgi:hypothetical protein
MSGTLRYKGINKFLNPEIKQGIKKKKIIRNACPVVKTLKA